MAFPANFPGRCTACGESIEPGDLIRSEGGRYVHEDCERAALPGAALDPTELRPGEVVCDVCFLVKPCECEET
ncbi:hypothetical protein [Agromyces sp. NBRC 114283]|uniref:hypothetical protein n=1 Tax=Agromyces sp. NBRC 114283 TaxID=2994521 RepID=UPI0024A3078C|nr:hypothetical protein [Agromyces sp. NBRC 114283]GLU91319.1 hypothetical protein Agsp01_35740 [Agromyces sp. NBRC 114283]